MRKKAVNYINNKDLLAELIKFREARQSALDADEQLPQISRYIGQAIQLIADRLSRKGNFSGYSFKEDMKSDGVENCIMYLHNFNPAKSSNPFAYLTQIIYQAYVRRIEKEAKHSYIRHKLMVNSSMLNGIGVFDKSDMEAINSVVESSQNEKSSDIIGKFEDKIAEKKNKKIRKKEEAELGQEDED